MLSAYTGLPLGICSSCSIFTSWLTVKTNSLIHPHQLNCVYICCGCTEKHLLWAAVSYWISATLCSVNYLHNAAIELIGNKQQNVSHQLPHVSLKDQLRQTTESKTESQFTFWLRRPCSADCPTLKKAKHQQTNLFYKKETFQEADEFWQDDKDE